MTANKEILKGDIYYADLSSSDQNLEGVRPVLIIQNNNGNKFAPTTIVAAITSRINNQKLPTHVLLSKDEFSFLDIDSVVLLEQIRTIDKKRLKNYKGHLDDLTMLKVRKALFTSFGEEDCLK